MQKSSLFHLLIFVIESILESHDQTDDHDHDHFWSCPPKKIMISFLIFVNLYQHVKNQFPVSVHSSDTVNLRVPGQDWPHPSLTMPNQKIFNQLLIFVNLYQYTKNELFHGSVMEI